MRHRKLSRQEDLIKIINECDMCNIAMASDNDPYVIPMNFAYDRGAIYLHSDPSGKKMQILKNNNNVCVSFSTGHEIVYVNHEVACSWGMKFKSVVAHGHVEFIDDLDEKVRVLNLIMKKYANGKNDFKYSEPALRNVTIFRVVIRKMDGRVLGY